MGAPTVAVLVNAGLTYYNGNYYSQRVTCIHVANEARCRTLEIEKIKKNMMIHVRILVEIVLLV